MNEAKNKAAFAQGNASLSGTLIHQAKFVRVRGFVCPQPLVVKVQRGKKEITYHDQRVVVRAGQFVLLPDHFAMTICNIPDRAGLYEAVSLAVPRVSLEKALTRLEMQRMRPQKNLPILLEPLPKAALDLVDTFFFPCSSFNDLPQAIIDLRIEELAIWLALCGALLSLKPEKSLTERLREMIAFEPAFEWSVDYAAHLVAKSPATLRRHLAAEGSNFTKILREVRLVQSIELLQSTKFTIARVSAEVGYASPQQFSARFKSRFGFSPNEIRKNTA